MKHYWLLITGADAAEFKVLDAVNIHFQQLLLLPGLVSSSAVVLWVALFLSQSPLCFQQPASHGVQGGGEAQVQLHSVFTQLHEGENEKADTNTYGG